MLAVPFVLGGMLLPALTAAPSDPAPLVIGMEHEGFAVAETDKETGVPVIRISAGQTLTFQNNSRWIHILGPGRQGLLEPPGRGAMSPRVMLQENDTYTTPAWSTPGTYNITCPVHPDMSAKVVVRQ